MSIKQIILWKTKDIEKTRKYKGVFKSLQCYKSHSAGPAWASKLTYILFLSSFCWGGERIYFVIHLFKPCLFKTNIYWLLQNYFSPCLYEGSFIHAIILPFILLPFHHALLLSFVISLGFSRFVSNRVKWMKCLWWTQGGSGEEKATKHEVDLYISCMLLEEMKRLAGVSEVHRHIS